MRIAIVHYHFRRGGVTSVVRNAVTALKGTARTVILSGEPVTDERLGDWRLVENLNYQTEYQPEWAAQLAEKLQTAALEALGAVPDVWHIHNSTLGKNPTLTAAICILVQRGCAVLLQPHDFAEDGRADNMRCLRSAFGRGADFARTVYPTGSRVHYAVLNSRDLAILQTAGLTEGACHLLANPVPIQASPVAEIRSPCPLPQPYYLYPTRAIRRKNIGEVLLWAALSKKAGTPCHFALTLAPDNPRWLEIYREWVAFAQEHELPVHFEVGSAPEADFATLVQQAEALLTTSIAEGFGLAFLESYSMGKDCVGRNLPAITKDFAQHGLDMGHLYDTLPVRHPVEERNVDFGQLSESEQRAVIGNVLEDPATVCIPNPMSLLQVNARRIERNRAAVARHYSPAAYGKRLLSIYKQLMQTDNATCGHMDALKIESAFSSMQRSPILQ